MPAKPRVRFVRAAESELYGSADRYNEERTGRGDDFLRVVRAAVEEIAEAPGRWPRGLHTHKRILGRFPFTIHYRFDAREIVIVAVAHQKRRPATGRADAERPRRPRPAMTRDPLFCPPEHKPLD